MHIDRARNHPVFRALPVAGACCVLIVLAVGKISEPYRPTYALPEWAYYGAAVVESLLAVGLLLVRRVAAWALLVCCVGAMLTNLLHSGEYG